MPQAQALLHAPRHGYCGAELFRAAVSRRIAESMKRINSDREARQARSDSAMGVPKTCAVCGLPGHNKRTCPQITHPAVRITRSVLCS